MNSVHEMVSMEHNGETGQESAWTWKCCCGSSESCRTKTETLNEFDRHINHASSAPGAVTYIIHQSRSQCRIERIANTKKHVRIATEERFRNGYSDARTRALKWIEKDIASTKEYIEFWAEHFKETPE